MFALTFILFLLMSSNLNSLTLSLSGLFLQLSLSISSLSSIPLSASFISFFLTGCLSLLLSSLCFNSLASFSLVWKKGQGWFLWRRNKSFAHALLLSFFMLSLILIVRFACVCLCVHVCRIDHQCPRGWWGSPTCGPCHCDTNKGFDPNCNKTSGHCHCKVIRKHTHTPLQLYSAV